MKYPIFGKAPALASAFGLRCIFASMLLAATIVGWVGPGFANDRDDETVRVMTRNVYFGADVGPIIQALLTGNPPVPVAAGQLLLSIRASRPAERAAAVAREIVRSRADLVGLQEAAIVRTGPFNNPGTDPAGAAVPETEVETDALELLLKELKRLREPYYVVAIVPGVDAQLPAAVGPSPADLIDARLTTRIVIIARSRADLELSNVQVQGFLRNVSFATPAGPLVNARGWASVDVEKGGRKFRFATTHLDADRADIRSLQAFEMIAGAGDTSLPVVFVGDFNVTPTSTTETTYNQFLAAGFVDAWSRKRPTDPGFTCCQAPNLLNPTSQLSERIDLIFLRGGFHIEDIDRVGEKPSDRIVPPPRLWPSDHAGVVATLRIPRGH